MKFSLDFSRINESLKTSNVNKAHEYTPLEHVSSEELKTDGEVRVIDPCQKPLFLLEYDKPLFIKCDSFSAINTARYSPKEFYPPNLTYDKATD